MREPFLRSGLKNARLFGGAIAVCLAGCGPNLTPVAQDAFRLALQPSKPQYVDRSPSVVLPGTQNQNLLYVSIDGFDDVFMYSYLGGPIKLVGKLTGLSEPAGLCADKNGDIFVANYGDGDIVEYAHAGTKPIATLQDPDYKPIACAVDPTTGNLAVTASAASSSGGAISIYQGARGTPKQYADGQLQFPEFLGYDGAGNLFADGFHYYYRSSGCCFVFSFDELAKGAHKFNHVKIDRYVDYAGAVAWDGKYVALGSSNDTIDRLKITASGATVAGTIKLGAAHEIVQFWLQGGRVIGVDGGYAAADFWHYPAGGRRFRTISGLYEPFGVAVSLR